MGRDNDDIIAKNKKRGVIEQKGNNHSSKSKKKPFVVEWNYRYWFHEDEWTVYGAYRTEKGAIEAVKAAIRCYENLGYKKIKFRWKDTQELVKIPL